MKRARWNENEREKEGWTSTKLFLSQIMPSTLNILVR